MNREINLKESQIFEICTLAESKKRELGFLPDTPIANDIFTILERLEIILVTYPIESDIDKPSFSAVIVYLEEEERKFVFIGLNTADYLDRQVFAIAHELYHFYKGTKSHLSRIEKTEKIVEAKANYFAAEYLLPQTELLKIIQIEFGNRKLDQISDLKLLRFIARLHCTWWLPYRSIVKRLYEVKSISEKQFKFLFAIKERDQEGLYYKIASATDRDTFEKLNSISQKVSTTSKQIETILSNYEDEIIDEDQLYETLRLFDHKPEDYGYTLEVDLDEEE